MVYFPCQVCRTPLSAQVTQVGQLVRCPGCMATLRVPDASAQSSAAVAVSAPGPEKSRHQSRDADGDPLPAPPPPPTPASMPPLGIWTGNRGTGRRFGFNCGHCSSRLEATESMGAQDGQCPTCGNNITIPILDRYGRLIDPKTRQIIKPDPHPVHAYAAAGDRAPRIIRAEDGHQAIRCPRCAALSSVAVNNCRSCGMPFTMEGTSVEAVGSSNGFCVASLVLGIIGIPTGCALLPPALAIIFGIVGFSQVSRSGVEGATAGGKGMAIAGIICGAIGLILAMGVYAR